MYLLDSLARGLRCAYVSDLPSAAVEHPLDSYLMIAIVQAESVPAHEWNDVLGYVTKAEVQQYEAHVARDKLLEYLFNHMSPEEKGRVRGSG